MKREEYDRESEQAVEAWISFRKLKPNGTLDEFVRILVSDLPTDFELLWDHPSFKHVLYLLFRAGAQPVLPEMFRPPQKAQASSRSEAPSSRVQRPSLKSK